MSHAPIDMGQYGNGANYYHDFNYIRKPAPCVSFFYTVTLVNLNKEAVNLDTG